MIVAFMCQAGAAAAPAAGAPARARTVEQMTAVTARASLFIAASSVLGFDGDSESCIRLHVAENLPPIGGGRQVFSPVGGHENVGRFGRRNPVRVVDHGMVALRLPA